MCKCGLNKEMHAKYFLVQLDICTKKRVHHWVGDFAFELDGMLALVHLNLLLLGSYSMFLGIGWLYLYRTKVDCYDKDIECLDDNGEKIILQGRRRLHQLKWL